MAHFPITHVEVLSITKLKSLHDLGQGRCFHFEQQVYMVSHERISIKTKWIPGLVFRKKRKVLLKILLAQEDVLSLVSSGDNMI
jgi:hypothetical protein